MRVLLPLLLLIPQDAPARKTERWVAAFYSAKWDAESGEGMTRPDGTDALQDHPEAFQDFSYRKAAWHRRHLEDMAAAGIDVAVCEFAANRAAVDALVEALKAAAKDGRKTPRVAPLTADPAMARLFLERIPEAHHAKGDGRPMIWLPHSKQASPEALAALRKFFVVADPAWGEPDLKFAAGGAFEGPRELDVVTLGPGYRDASLRIRDRDDGAWYERSWYIALKIRPRVVAIETWNRHDEGSSIGPTREHRRDYLERTKAFAEQFRRGGEIPRPKGRYSSAFGVSYHLKFEPASEGLRPVEGPGTPFEIVKLADQRILMAKPVEGRDRRVLAFAVDDSYALYERRVYEVQIQVLDKGPGKVVLEYDAAVPGKGEKDRTCRTAEPYYFTDSGDWATATFRLPDAAFANRQEGGSDFRLVTEKRGLSIRWIQLRAR
jgi:hypothetical protein